MRDLERRLARVLRKVAAKLALERDGRCRHRCASTPRPARPTSAGRSSLPETAERTALPGVATGLAVTGAGGDVLFIEASLADPETGAPA